MPLQKVEYEFPHEAEDNDEIEVSPSSAEELRVNTSEAEQPEYEVEVVDDTPKVDRNRKASEPPEDVTDEELEEYSEKVRKRIQHFSKGYHDERRAKEQALREREELERLSQQLVEENKKLKSSANKNQTALLEQAKRVALAEVEKAKKDYKDAYEAGDSDAVLAAQDSLTSAKIKLSRLSNLKVTTLQGYNTSGNVAPQDAPAPVKADKKAEAWLDANPWFNKDVEMTSYALGLHNKLVRDGVDPKSDEYYERIDARMRQLFPENFTGGAEVQEKSPRKSSNVVAPATRSTAPKKIRLTRTQVTLAKRLGLTPEQYARQVAEDMRKNNG